MYRMEIVEIPLNQVLLLCSVEVLLYFLNEVRAIAMHFSLLTSNSWKWLEQIKYRAHFHFQNQSWPVSTWTANGNIV